MSAVAAHPHVIAPGPSIRLVTLEGLALEFGITIPEVRGMLDKLNVDPMEIGMADGPKWVVNIHALETALFTVTDPNTPLEAMAAVADMYAGVKRKALLAHLKCVGHIIFPEIRRAKSVRSIRSARKPGRPKGSRDKIQRVRRTVAQVRAARGEAGLLATGDQNP